MSHPEHSAALGLDATLPAGQAPRGAAAMPEARPSRPASDRPAVAQTRMPLSRGGSPTTTSASPASRRRTWPR